MAAAEEEDGSCSRRPMQAEDPAGEAPEQPQPRASSSEGGAAAAVGSAPPPPSAFRAAEKLYQLHREQEMRRRWAVVRV